jgi:sugar-specific transcriptional regulator TrmB
VKKLLPIDKAVQALVGLGLTVLQARVYIATARLGTSTGRAIAKTAEVASQDVYRVLTELQEKRLIEKIIAKPNKYRPIPLQEGLLMLLQQRDEQTEEIKEAMVEIAKRFQSIDKHENKYESCEFALIPEKEPIHNRMKRMLETAEVSVDLSSDFQNAIESLEKKGGYEQITKSTKRGIRVRDLLGPPPDRYQIPKKYWALKRNSAYQSRFMRTSLPIKLWIKDRKETLISTKKATTNIQTPYLWSNNPILVQIIQEWYDMMWKNAAELSKGENRNRQKGNHEAILI